MGTSTVRAETTQAPREESSADVSVMMMLMNQIQQQYQTAMLQMQEQAREPVVEPPPEIKRRTPINIKLKREQIRAKLQKDLEEERRRRVRLADTVYSEFSLLEEAPPQVLKAGLLMKGED